MESDDDGMLHAVRFSSYSTTRAHANYNSEDLEALALIYALKPAECLAQCRHVTVLTDNTHVLHIVDWTPQNRRQRRMLTYILCSLDCLSRLFQDACENERRENEPQFIHDADDFILPVLTRLAVHAAVDSNIDENETVPLNYVEDTRRSE